MATVDPTVEYDEAATCWHLMVTTYGGKVSMLQNLDAPTARQAYRRLRPQEWPREFINQPESGCWSWMGSDRYYSSDDIGSVSILGPEGAKLDPWRGVEPVIIDLALEREERDHDLAR